jgi:hypothetical protein
MEKTFTALYLISEGHIDADPNYVVARYPAFLDSGALRDQVFQKTRQALLSYRRPSHGTSGLLDTHQP